MGIEDRVDAGRVRLARLERPLEEGLREKAAKGAEPPRASLEPLGMRYAGDVFGRAAQVAGNDVVADPAPVGVPLLDLVAKERSTSAVSATAPLTESEIVGGSAARGGAVDQATRSFPGGA